MPEVEEQGEWFIYSLMNLNQSWKYYSCRKDAYLCRTLCAWVKIVQRQLSRAKIRNPIVRAARRPRTTDPPTCISKRLIKEL